MKRSFSLILTAAFALASLAVAQTVPSGMTYQGRLTDASNAPVPDGTGYEIEVRLWSAPTGGTLLWGTRYSGVPLKGGAFNLILGSGGTSIAGATTTDLKAAFNNPTVHLGLTTTKSASGAAIQSPTEILPRQQIFSTPYAFRAQTAAVAESAQTDGILSAAIKDGEVKSADIAPSAVQTAQLADQSVTTAKIANGAILGEDLAAETITPDRLAQDFACVVDEKPAGTSGGSAIVGWNKRDLNKLAYSQGNSVSVAGNAITLKTGTYLISGEVSSYETQENKAALRRSGDSTAVIYGATTRNRNGSCPTASFSGIVTVTAPTESFEVWHYISVNGNGVNNLGVSLNAAGTPEIYTTVKIMRMK